MLIPGELVTIRGRTAIHSPYSASDISGQLRLERDGALLAGIGDLPEVSVDPAVECVVNGCGSGSYESVDVRVGEESVRLRSWESARVGNLVVVHSYTSAAPAVGCDSRHGGVNGAFVPN